MNPSRKQRKLSGFPLGAAVVASNGETNPHLHEKEPNMGTGDNMANIDSLVDVPAEKSSEKLAQKENRVRISSRRKNGNSVTDRDTSKKRTSSVVGRKGTSPVIAGRKVLRLSNGKKLDTDVVRRKIKRISVTKNVLMTKNIVKKSIAVTTEKSKINKNASVPSPANGSVSSTGFFYPGCHLSTAGGLHNAVIAAVNLGCKSMALFLRPQRTWAAPPLDPEVADKFKTLCVEHGFPPHLILPHGSYLLNLGSPKEEQREKSVQLLVEELGRCHRLGLNLFNIHPGSSCGEISRSRCAEYIAEGINRVHRETVDTGVKVVIENMSCQGHTLGGDLGELRQIIDMVTDQSRIGVCLDTCHAMAAGYDLSTEEGFERLCSEFEEKVGWKWLVGAHLNDSLGPAGCHRDRHANIGKGCIGEEGFRRIMNSPHFKDIPLILETPLDKELGQEGYRREIQLLTGMVRVEESNSEKEV